jgi:hypothetical protein
MVLGNDGVKVTVYEYVVRNSCGCCSKCVQYQSELVDMPAGRI